MKSKSRLALFVPFLVGAACAQSTPPTHPQEIVAEGLYVNRAELMRQKPLMEAPHAMRIWAAEKTPEVGALLVELNGVVPMHLHVASDHRIYMIEGKMNVLVGTRTVTMSPGDFLLVPRGVRHKFSLVEGHARAVFATVDNPLVDPKKNVWLEPAPTPAGAPEKK